MADVVVAGLGEPALEGEDHRLAVDGLVNRPSKMRHSGAGYIALSLGWSGSGSRWCRTQSRRRGDRSRSTTTTAPDSGCASRTRSSKQNR